MFSEEGEDKRTFWQKHKGKILAGAALAAAGGAGYYYRDPIKKKAGELYDAGKGLAEKTYYKYWMSEEDINNELDKCWDIVKSFDIDGMKTIPGRLEKIVKFCIYNAGDNQPTFVKEAREKVSKLSKYLYEGAKQLGLSDLSKEANEILKSLS